MTPCPGYPWTPLTRPSSPGMLQFLSSWLVRDSGRLGASLAGYTGHPAYGTAQLRQDLDRFTFLLGGDDGESLFGLGPAG